MYIIDFDDTLFDTRAFKQARLDSVKRMGVSDEDYYESYVEARNSSDGLFTYSNERHAEMLTRRGYEKEKILTALEETTGEQLSTFLFQDTIAFLDHLKSFGKPMILLSLGDPSFQELKVKGSGIDQYFDRLFMVNDEKSRVVQELLDNHSGNESDVWFVNDKPGEAAELREKFPGIHILLRKSEAIEEAEYQKNNIPYYVSLTELSTYVR